VSRASDPADRQAISPAMAGTLRSDARPSSVVAATLKERARQLAQEKQARGSDEQVEVLGFQLAWESYAVETYFVREVYPLKDLTPIPCTPPFLLGVINLRGELCPVIELKRLFGLPDAGITNATCAVILHDPTMEVGILADVILGVHALDIAELQPPPVTFSGINASFLRGVTKDRLAVLDARNILAHPGIVVNEQVGE
jgi:purine-binding chemotaxis protein CheW